MERLRALRAKKGISQRELARQLNLLPQTYSNYENGTREPSHETVVALADYFNVTTDYLLGRVDKLGETEGDGADVKVALFGGDGEITEAMWDEVKRFAEFVKLREKERYEES